MKQGAPWVFGLCLVLGGCSRPEPEAGKELPAVSAPEESAAPRGTADTGVNAVRSGRPIALPVPVAKGAPTGPISAASQALRAEGVEQAIVADMGEAAAGIDVRVEQGIVHLSGDVATEADLQRAHYVARALNGVIEVDQSQMRVIR